MYLKVVVLAIIVLILTIYLEVKNYKKKGFDLIIALVGVVIALVILSYSLFEEYTGISKIANAMLFAIQSLSLNEDFEIIGTVSKDGIVNNIYIILTYMLYFIAPFLSASVLISLFSNVFSNVKLKASRNKELHIFSEINDKTVNLANRIFENNKNVKIAFTNRESISSSLKINRHFLKIKEKINDINLSKIKEKNVYFMSEDEDRNLNECLEFLDKINETEKANIYILNDKPEAYMIIDSVMSKYYNNPEIINGNINSNLKVEIINEAESIVLNRLKELPIKSIFKRNKRDVTVLIVGCGKFGQAFLKNITWCFQVIGYRLQIIVVEKNANDVVNKISLEAPELLKKYSIHFVNDSIESVIANDVLKNVDIDYTIVTAGNDTNNFNIAIALRRYFLVNNKDDVLIDVSVNNTYKSKNIGILKNEANKEYNLNTFGDIRNIYYENPIIDKNIEEMAKIVHSINWSDDEYFIEFYKSEYNRKSSKAVVIHLKYKLYSILLDSYIGNLDEDIENYKKIITNAEIIDMLVKNEHSRWVAYMYADGYRLATIDKVEKYYSKIGNLHKYTLAKLHPALVENDDVIRAQEDLNNLIGIITGTKGKKSFVESDFKLVQRLDEIVMK